MSKQDTTEDPRAAAEEALRLHEAATPGEWATESAGLDDDGRHQEQWYLPGVPYRAVLAVTHDGSPEGHANARLAQEYRTLTPILARAVIEQADANATMRAELRKLMQDFADAAIEEARDQIAAQEALQTATRERDAARAELASPRAVAAAARDLSDAAHECDREAERPTPSQSSAPLVRQIKAMARLRTALAALPPDAEPRTAPLTERQARKVWSEAMWQRSEDDTPETVAIRCIVAASNRGAIPPEVRAGESGDPFTQTEAHASRVLAAAAPLSNGARPRGIAIGEDGTWYPQSTATHTFGGRLRSDCCDCYEPIHAKGITGCKHAPPWNWCPKCRTTVDDDMRTGEFRDGSEGTCSGCGTVYVAVSFHGGTWELHEQGSESDARQNGSGDGTTDSEGK